MLDMALATQTYSGTDETMTSNSFQEYWSNCEKLRQLETNLQDAKKELTASEQLVTLFTVLQNPTQLKACQDAALYYKRLITEIVSCFLHFQLIYMWNTFHMTL